MYRRSAASCGTVRTGANSIRGTRGASASSHRLQIRQDLSTKLLPIVVMVGDIGHGNDVRGAKAPRPVLCRTRPKGYWRRCLSTRGTLRWRNALKWAGIADFRWHYLRHTWASRLIQNGTPVHDLQEMGGWKSAAMVRRYAHLAPAHMTRHVR